MEPHLNSHVPLITPSVKYEFGDLQFRAVHAQVKKLVGQQGGQIPITDPFAVLALGLVMDKLNEMSERLAVLEEKSSPVRTGM